MDELSEAVAAIQAGELVVYPTDTVYGLGGDARSEAAVERVFELKQRRRTEPLSVAVSSVSAVREIATPTPRTTSFMKEFLPGPVTVICSRRNTIPDSVTAGKDRVGIRIPDHDVALALLDQTGPITATSANPSGGENVQTVSSISARISAGVATVLDAGSTPGGESTVVDVDRGTIYRHGQQAQAVTDWLAEQSSADALTD